MVSDVLSVPEWTDKVCVWMSHTAVAATLDLNGPALSNRGHLAFVQSVGK